MIFHIDTIFCLEEMHIILLSRGLIFTTKSSLHFEFLDVNLWCPLANKVWLVSVVLKRYLVLVLIHLVVETVKVYNY